MLQLNHVCTFKFCFFKVLSCQGVVMNDYFYAIYDFSGLYQICLSKQIKWELIFKYNGNGFIEDILTDHNHVLLII